MKTSKLALFAISTCFAWSAWGADTAAPTDPQIAQIVVTANQLDIDAGKMAKSRAKSDEVKRFAEQMVTDHTAVNKSAKDLVDKLKVKPEESDASKSMKKGGEESMANLKKLKGDAFDRAYIDHEVTFHQTVLQSIDNSLIPNAKNDELKALIVKVRPSIEAHLNHAKQIQGGMAKGG